MDTKNNCEKKTEQAASFSMFWRIVQAFQNATILFPSVNSDGYEFYMTFSMLGDVFSRQYY